MNEEWYNDALRAKQDADWVRVQPWRIARVRADGGQRPNYETWLTQLVAAHHTHLDARDRTFARFLLDIPDVPPDLLALVRELCVERERCAPRWAYAARPS
jgi:symplekin